MVIDHTPAQLRKNRYQADKIKAKKTTVKWLRKVEDAILEEPKRLNMDVWGGPYSGLNNIIRLDRNVEVHIPRPLCNTVACIAGHTLLVSPKGRKHLNFKTVEIDGKLVIEVVEEFPFETREVATEILHITQNQADSLFAPPGLHDGVFEYNHWPRIFEEAYSKARTPQQRANVACNRIESFIESLE